MMEISNLWQKLEAAEQMEHEARTMEAQGFHRWLDMSCDICWKSESCRSCEFQPYCSEMHLVYHGKMDELFRRAYDTYVECAQGLRRIVTEHPTEEAMLLLARCLRNMDIHPKNMEQDPRGLYWEAQYWFLRLYYTFGKDDYLRQAQQLEDFRHADVRKYENGHYCALPADL